MVATSRACESSRTTGLSTVRESARGGQTDGCAHLTPEKTLGSHGAGRALRHDTESVDAHNRLGILLVANGRVDEGHALLARAHQLAPHDPSPLLHLAQACALLGRADEAERLVGDAEKCGADPQLARAVRAEILAKPA